jgi:hypothetical protein
MCIPTGGLPPWLFLRTAYLILYWGTTYYNRQVSEPLDNAELNVDEKAHLYELAEIIDSIGYEKPHSLLTSIECQAIADIFHIPPDLVVTP